MAHHVADVHAERLRGASGGVVASIRHVAPVDAWATRCPAAYEGTAVRGMA
ncbi:MULTISPECIES: hypothetical protein [unclassified Streptomyces]|uniref:hypothetical protein n=1 Tax=unclassified Streptomyces TaxID=2593676 RepID=UPI0038093920